MMVRVVHEQRMLHVSAREHGGDSKGLPVGSGLALGSPGHPEDGGLSDQFQSPMSEGSYKEGPASVPEPSLPEDFLEEEEQYQEFGLRADLGDEGFIDRREETIAVVPQKLSPDEVPEKEADFKTCLNDYSPAGTRRRIYSPDQSREVSNSSVSGGRGAKQNQTEGKGVTLRPAFRNPSPASMDDIVIEGPEREEVDVKEETEILPDGTLHSTQHVFHHKIKHVKRTHTDPGGKEDVYEEDVAVPGTSKEDVYELFEHPPKLVQEAEDIEVLQDGRKVKKHVVMNRMVHLVKMHHESFDEEHHKTEEDYEVEEVIPGTESAFVAGQDSDYEEDEPSVDRGQASSGAGARVGSDPATGSAPGHGDASPKLVSYQYGSDVDGSRYPGCGPGESPLDVVEDMLARGALTLDDLQGDDNNEYVGPHGDEEESYTHRVVMKKEVHQKTTIRADGQEETVITEDSQIHQDSEPPEALRQSMEEIIQQFMTDSPQMPRVRGVDDDDRAEGDDGTEV